jgi:hypothetical protein
MVVPCWQVRILGLPSRRNGVVQLVACAERIKTLVQKFEEASQQTAGLAVQIGLELLEAKQNVPHGEWGRWCQQELGWAERTAQRYMAIAKRFKTASAADLGVQVLEFLSRATVPESAVNEVVALSREGVSVTLPEAKAIAALHRGDVAPALPRPKKQSTEQNRIADAIADVYTPPALPPAQPQPEVAVPSKPLALATEVGSPVADVLAVQRQILRLASQLPPEAREAVWKSIGQMPGEDGRPLADRSRVELLPAPVSAEPPASKQATRFRPETVGIPEKLAAPRFRAAWTNWCTYNEEAGHPLTETVAEAQIASLAARSVDAACDALKQAIANRSQSIPAAKEVAGRFKPPTVDEVREYIESKGFERTVDAERFVSYYEAQGWKLSNGVKMSRWQAAVANWHKLQQERKKLGTTTTEATDGAYRKFQPDRRRRSGTS